MDWRAICAPAGFALGASRLTQHDLHDLLREPMAHEREGLALYNALLDHVTRDRLPEV